MKAILISIRPQWVELILNLIKKDEVRKGTAVGKAINRLIKEQGVAPMLIYCTKNGGNLASYKGSIAHGFENGNEFWEQRRANGKVVAHFNATAEEITTRQDRFKEFTFYETSLDMEDLLKQSCLDYNELDNYLQGEKGTVIHINDLEIFDKPKEISEFKRDSGRIGLYATPHGNILFHIFEPLTRAPQSYCYIEI